MQLKDVINTEAGFKYCIDDLNIQSGIGRNYLMNIHWKTTAQELEAEWFFVEQIIEKIKTDEERKHLGKLQHKLSCIHNIKQTILNIENNDVLDDVQFFEVKNLSLQTIEIAAIAKDMGLDLLFLIPDLSKVLEILDPDKNNIAHFYIYESYDNRLPEIRNKLKQLTNSLNSNTNTLPDEETAKLEAEITATYLINQEIEDSVRVSLVEKLNRYTPTLKATLERLAYIDLSVAKAEQAINRNMHKPTICSHSIAYTNIVNPRLDSVLKPQGQECQPIDISIAPGVCFITGANMAGKTVLLKTMGIAQMLAQFGFFVPAAVAGIALVDKVVFCIGDEQNEMNGLSSFASEILKINSIVEDSDKYKMLILIDEPARTTNPTEGKAIVQAIANCLNSKNSYTMITTHYSQLGLDCRKLRVKGFVNNNTNITITPQNINKFMNYTLQEDTTDNVPHEAIRIAEILNCSSTLISDAKQFLDKEKNN